MDGAETETLFLQDYIASLDKSSLPRILQICSGVYFQGSVYEVSGSEVCLSTGDLVKVIGIKLQSVTCYDLSTQESSELPLDYAGRFQIVPQDEPFCSIEDMVELIPAETSTSNAFRFTSLHELELEGCAIPEGQPVKLLSIERRDEDEEEFALCRLVGREQDQEVEREILVPITFRGVFYECENSHSYTIQEIVSSPHLRQRNYRRVRSSTNAGPFRLRPVYSIQAIMHMRKNVVQFPSSLEVDVMDVSDRGEDVVFITPLSLPEVSALSADAFPAIAQILDAPANARQLFHSCWLLELRAGRCLVLHGMGESALLLASSSKGKSERRHFLLSRQRYGGSFRRRPRNFSSAYELYAASCRSPTGLTVTVAMPWEASGEGDELTSLSVGDQLEVLGRQERTDLGHRDNKGEGAVQELEVLVCRRTSEVDEDDEEEEEDQGQEEMSKEVLLPMYAQGQFVEKLVDTKKRYSLTELADHFPLPLDVKVIRRDPGMEADPLPALSALWLEEATTEPVLTASFLDEPNVLFELPVRWLSMSVCFTHDPLPWPETPPSDQEWRWKTVTEVTDEFYFEFRRLASHDTQAPPPRPPKRRPSSNITPPTSDSPSSNRPPRLPKTSALSQSLDHLKLSIDRPSKGLPLPPPVEISEDAPPPIISKPGFSNSSIQPNTYTKTPRRKKKERRCSDHDYEDIEDVVRNAQESVMFY
ncbi:hypothetical protein GJAV_G00009890 [Gymnothorax javanicus]|nr:hypothetical protein GJAV_G00009890 [Gymnothorax javanicus]